MKTLVIDRLEGIYAICREQSDKPRKEKDQKYFGIQISELPHGAAAGDILSVDDENGAITLTKAAPAVKRV